MTKLIGFSGSLRAKSYNAALLHAAPALMPDGATLEIGTIKGIPLYDADEEALGMPGAVALLKEQIATSDGILIVTPEYNHSLPGVLKNAIDWLTRPSADIARLFAGRAVAIIGASPGGFGTVLAQEAWLPVLKTLGCRPWFGGQLMVSHVGTVFDDAGKIIAPKVEEQLRNFLRGYAAYVESHAGSAPEAPGRA